MTNLAHNSGRNREELAAAGLVDEVLQAMHTWPADPKLQRQASWALLTLAASDEVSYMYQKST